MPDSSTNALQQQIDSIYRAESRRVFATLVRLLRDFDLAEEAMHEAFAAALQRWKSEGVPANPKSEGLPANPRTWLVSAARLPSAEELPQRLQSVLAMIYLVFNEGYSASSGDSLTRADLSGEAIRLGRLLVELLPDAEAMGLLALILLQESRRRARATAEGDVILLEHQDRSLWDGGMVAEGQALVECALRTRRFGNYSLQAAIAAVHASAATADSTDWPQIVALYHTLYAINPSPVVELNRAVAIAMRDGPAAGLALIDAILRRGDLRDYHLAYAAQAELCRRAGRIDEARAAYQRAYWLAKQEPERRCFPIRRSIASSPARPATRCSEGPRFDGAGSAKNRDTIEVIDRDHWKFSGEVLLDDGSWQNIMSSDNRRR